MMTEGSAPSECRCFLNAAIQLFLSDLTTANALVVHVFSHQHDICISCSLGLVAAQRNQQHPGSPIDAERTARLLSSTDETCCGLSLPGLEYGQQQDTAAAFLAIREHVLQEVSSLFSCLAHPD